MPDIYSVVKSVKLSWVVKLVTKNSHFTDVARACTGIENFELFFNYKNDERFLNKDIPLFYRQLSQHWYELHNTDPVQKNDILNEIIWMNRSILIENRPVFYKSWVKQGIVKLNDIVDNNGSLITVWDLNRSYGINIDIMMLNSLKSAIPKRWLKTIKGRKVFTEKPMTLMLKNNHVEKNLTDIKTKDLYWEYIAKKSTLPTSRAKWEELYYYVNFDWSQIYTLPYAVARETKLQSLQFQILNRYIPCKRFLYMCNKEETDKCQFCGEIDEIDHYFYTCDELKPFFNSFNEWFSDTMEINIVLHSPDIIFGIPNDNNDDLLYSLNFCILFVKSYIFQSKKEGETPIFEIFKHRIKERLTTEKYILETQNKNETFEKVWQKLYESL